MLEFNFIPFPELVTANLRLRQITKDDADELLFLRSNETTMRYIDKPRTNSRKEALELIQKITDGIKNGTGINWGICLRTDATLIGTIAYWRTIPEHYRAEIGYMLHSEFNGRGLMSEAMKEVIKYGFEKMNLHSIEANVNPANVASMKLLEKFSFVREAYFKENFYYNGKFLDSAIYSLVKT